MSCSFRPLRSKYPPQQPNTPNLCSFISVKYKVPHVYTVIYKFLYVILSCYFVQKMFVYCFSEQYSTVHYIILIYPSRSLRKFFALDGESCSRDYLLVSDDMCNEFVPILRGNLLLTQPDSFSWRCVTWTSFIHPWNRSSSFLWNVSATLLSCTA